MLLWALTLTLLPMALSGTLLNHLTDDALADGHEKTVHNLAQTAAASMAARLERGDTWSRSADELVELLRLDTRFAFVQIYDPSGRLIRQHVLDARAWQLYRDAVGQPDGVDISMQAHQPHRLARGTVAVQHVDFASSVPPGRADAMSPARGRLVLALRDPTLAATVDHLLWIQLTVVGVILLVTLPVIFVGIRQWTGPLHRLVAATADLAARRHPQPVPVTTNDEVGLLADQFNAMVRTLARTHRELEQANAQLEEKVRSRTAELNAANERLAEEIRSKNEFLRAVSHDLHAPVRNIVGLAGMLLRKHGRQYDEATRTKLERIRSNAHLQTDMIEELLELSRLSSPPARQTDVELGQLIHEIRANLAYDLERAGVTLTADGPLPTLHADRARLRQVFQNLIENAIKYMLDAPVRQIAVHCQSEAAQYVFCVSDTGSGIAPGDLERVFQPFQRGRDTEAEGVAGRGVGLASVKSLIEAWGGRIWVHSEPGAGSSFYFTAPYAHVGAPPADLVAEQA